MELDDVLVIQTSVNFYFLLQLSLAYLINYLVFASNFRSKHESCLLFLENVALCKAATTQKLPLRVFTRHF